MTRNPTAHAVSFALMALMVTFALVSDVHAKKRRKKSGGIKFGKVGMMTLAGSGSFTGGSFTPILEGDEGDSQDEATSFKIAPRVGYFVWGTPTLALELAGVLEFARSDSDDVSTSSLAFLVDPAIYLKSMKRRGLFPFLHFGLGYGNAGIEPDKGDSQSSSGMDLRPGVGLNFCIGKKRGAFIRTTLDYEMQTLLDDKENGRSRSGPALRVGFGAFF